MTLVSIRKPFSVLYCCNNVNASRNLANLLLGWWQILKYKFLHLLSWQGNICMWVFGCPCMHPWVLKFSYKSMEVAFISCVYDILWWTFICLFIQCSIIIAPWFNWLRLESRVIVKSVASDCMVVLVIVLEYMVKQKFSIDIKTINCFLITIIKQRITMTERTMMRPSDYLHRHLLDGTPKKQQNQTWLMLFRLYREDTGQGNLKRNQYMKTNSGL